MNKAMVSNAAAVEVCSDCLATFWFHPVLCFAAVHCMYSKSQPKQTGAGTSSAASSVALVLNLHWANERKRHHCNFVAHDLFADLCLCHRGRTPSACCTLMHRTVRYWVHLLFLQGCQIMSRLCGENKTKKWLPTFRDFCWPTLF